MAKRNRSSWLIIYWYNDRKEYVQTPMLRYVWECQLWLLDQKPSAEIVSIQPYRSMSVPK